MSNKIGETGTVMTESTDSPESVDLSDVAGAIVDQFRSRNESADISLVRPDEVTISSRQAVLRRVLFELVENSLEHTAADAPRVELRVREVSDGTVRLSVADDRLGIRERERDILAAGTKTQLEHGQGIGLWFVNWAVTQLGGEIELRENDPEGSLVTIRLYDPVR
jgi:signal transduction histidine kinase